MDTDKYIGRLLDNRYEIKEVIGIGGMAVVYKARSPRLNRLVAIKILKDDYSRDKDFRRRFHAESQAVAMLSHPNIVSVYDVSSGEADYIVMELIDGISLKQYMEKKGVLNWKETLHFAIQICKALEHAHSRGLVHRDIKPHNIMVLKNGSIKVTDFGIARVMSKSNTLTKEALGSVHYISPEQAKGGRVDDRSDLYSLGTVMYEMITGRPPYDGESPVAVAIQHINGGARMPSTLNPNIPGGLEQIIMKAMAHEPADRYASATAMLYDMDEFRKLPSLLFDYNLPPIDAVMNLKSNQPAPKTAAERAAEAGSPVRRRETGRDLDLRQKSTARAALARSRMRRRSKEDYAEDDGRSRTAMIAVAACSVVALAAIVIFLMLLLGGVGSNSPQLVMVPTLVGKTYETYKSNGDIVLGEPEFVYDESFESGKVCYQDPKPGEKVEKGTIVSIKVSKGPAPEIRYMDNLVNQKQDIAKNFLTNKSISFLVQMENDDTVEKDHVIRTEPAAGEEIKDGQTVILYISMGPEMKDAIVPSVVNQSLETAKTILNMQGVKIDIQVKEENNDTVPKDGIIRTEPAAGEKMKTGDTVTIYISLGPKTAKMPNLLGKSLKAALELLEYAGFTNVKYDEYVENTAPRDQVLYQSVEMNEEIPLNTKIELKLSTGTKEVVFGLVEDMVEPYSVKIVRKDTGEVVFEGQMKDGESEVKLNLTGKGIVTYVITIEGLGEREEKVDFTTP